jgi:hypothetical protein
MTLRKALLLMLLTVLLLPAEAAAQRRDWRSDNPWSFSPYGGLFKDAYDISIDGADTGWLVGFRVGYEVSDRARLVGNVGYAESDDVSSGPITLNRIIYDNQYIITTGGLEYDILPGNTSVSLGAEAGGLWREVSFDRVLGGGPADPTLESGFTFYFVAVPTLTIRHGFTPRTALELGIRDFIQPEDEVQHLPALMLGLRFR